MTTVRISASVLRTKDGTPFLTGVQLVDADCLEIYHMVGSNSAASGQLLCLKGMLTEKGWHFSFETTGDPLSLVVHLRILCLDTFDSFKWAELEQAIGECFWNVAPRS